MTLRNLNFELSMYGILFHRSHQAKTLTKFGGE